MFASRSWKGLDLCLLQFPHYLGSYASMWIKDYPRSTSLGLSKLRIISVYCKWNMILRKLKESDLLFSSVFLNVLQIFIPELHWSAVKFWSKLVNTIRPLNYCGCYFLCELFFIYCVPVYSFFINCLPLICNCRSHKLPLFFELITNQVLDISLDMLRNINFIQLIMWIYYTCSKICLTENVFPLTSALTLTLTFSDWQITFLDWWIIFLHNYIFGLRNDVFFFQKMYRYQLCNTVTWTAITN